MGDYTLVGNRIAYHLTESALINGGGILNPAADNRGRTDTFMTSRLLRCWSLLPLLLVVAICSYSSVLL
jgi:hypothetical protein